MFGEIVITKNPLRTITNSIILGIVICTGIWAILLIHSSRALQRNNSTSQQVFFGPLYLNNLSKEPLGTAGYSVRISLENGAIAYVACWSVAGGLLGGLRYYQSKRKQKV